MTATITIMIDQAIAARPAGSSPPSAPAAADGQRAAASVPSAMGVAAHRTGRGVLATGSAAVEHLLRLRAALPAGHPDRAALRIRAIEAGLPLSRQLAARYRERGEPLDDLYQVAAVGLIKAVDGYDTAQPGAFISYAVPTITGALKRHFRDTTWRIRVPRRVQELALALTATSAALAQQLGRSPTRAELAVHLDAAEQDVAVASHASHAHRPISLDGVPGDGDRGQTALRDTLGGIDARFDAVTDQHVWDQLLNRLPAREQRILSMRFSHEMTQSEIAAQIGVSQMQISRLLLRSLTTLRTGMRPTGAPRASNAGTGPGPAPATTSR